MSLATLSINLDAKTAQFAADMGKAVRTTERAAAQISGALGAIKSAAGGLVAGVSFAGLVALTKSAIDSLDALNDLKDATGATIENISALEDVAARTGTSFETVGTSLVKFNTALKEAKPGSDAEAAFKAIGLSVKELQALDPAEALRRTAVALAGFADDGNKARLVQELFGKSIREVAPFLHDLAEQGSLVAKVTSEQAAEAEKFNKELFAMQKNAQDLTRAIAGPLLTAVNNLIASFREGSKAGKGFFETALENYVKDVKGIYAKLGIGGGPKSAQFLLNYTPPSANDTANARLLRQGAFDKPSVAFSGAAKVAKVKPDGIQPITTDLDRYLEQLERTVEKEQELSTLETARLRISEASANGFSEALRNRVLDLATQIDGEKQLKLVREASAKAAQDQANALGAFEQQQKAALDALLAPTATAQLEKQREDVQLLTVALEQGIISEQQYLEAVTARLDLTGEKIKETKSLAEELGLTFTSAFENAAVSGGKFSSVLKGVGQDLLRLFIRKEFTEPAGAFISNTFGGGGGGSGGTLFGSLLKFFSADGGGFTGYGPRSGGVDGKGGFFGILHPNETVYDHTRGQRGGGGVTNNYFTVGDVATVSMVRQAIAQSQRQTGAAIRRNVDYGGELGRA